MSTVCEIVDVFPFDTEPRVLQRQEELLLGEPHAGKVKLWKDQPPLEATHFDPQYVPTPFAPPRGIFESDHLRVEWQIMNFRQPFYHRNADVDELSFQIGGERTLMTELGSVELRAGDFSRIPRGVAHDNWGREQTHLLFYLPAPVEDLLPASRCSEVLVPPFPGWVASPNNELITECLGGPEHDVAISPIDEELLLRQAERESEQIRVLRPDADTPGTTWLYRSAAVMIGRTHLPAGDGREYRRHLDVDEIQYQIHGHRTLVTQRGVLQIEPGDLVRIPVGTAFTSVADQDSAHITLVSTKPIPQVEPSTKTAEPVTTEHLEQLRRGNRLPRTVRS